MKQPTHFKFTVNLNPHSPDEVAFLGGLAVILG